MHATTKLLAAGWFLAAPLFGQLADSATDPAEDLAKFTREVLIPERLKLIDGDIVVPIDFDESRATFGTSLWPNGRVPYEFATNVGSTNEQRMIAAMQEWESLADVNFAPRNGEADYIRIISDSFNASEFLGRNGGRQRVWITSWTTHGTLVHELGHVLGFYHEQSRADRNTFVQINFNNVSQTACTDSNGNPASCNSQFTIRDPGDSEHGPYDFGSVMHYGACAFSNCTTCAATNNSCATITVLAPNTAQQTLIGQRVGASFWDGRVMSFLYPEDNWVFADDQISAIPFGTFLDPFGLAQALLIVPNNGKVWLKPGTYGGVGRIERPMKLEATYTAVRILN